MTISPLKPCKTTDGRAISKYRQANLDRLWVEVNETRMAEGAIRRMRRAMERYGVTEIVPDNDLTRDDERTEILDYADANGCHYHRDEPGQCYRGNSEAYYRVSGDLWCQRAYDEFTADTTLRADDIERVI